MLNISQTSYELYVIQAKPTEMLTSQNEVSVFFFPFFVVAVVALYVSVLRKCLVMAPAAAAAATSDKVINLNFYTKPEERNRVTHANLFSISDFQYPFP